MIGHRKYVKWAVTELGKTGGFKAALQAAMPLKARLVPVVASTAEVDGGHGLTQRTFQKPKPWLQLPGQKDGNWAKRL